MSNLITRPAPFSSLDLDSTEAIRSSGSQNWNIANSWSVSCVFRPRTQANYTNPRAVFELTVASATIADRIRVYVSNFFGTPVFFSNIGHDNNTNQKTYLYGGYQENVWQRVTLTWNGTNLVFYINDVLTAPGVIATDDAITQANVNRILHVGETGGGGSGGRLVGHYNQIAFWNTPLTAGAVSEIHQGGTRFTDLKVNRGSYTQAHNLVHWARFGYDTSALGRDYTDHSNKINFTGSALNVSVADVTLDAPYGLLPPE